MCKFDSKNLKSENSIVSGVTCYKLRQVACVLQNLDLVRLEGLLFFINGNKGKGFPFPLINSIMIDGQ